MEPKIVYGLRHHILKKDLNEGLIDMVFKEAMNSKEVGNNKYIQIPSNIKCIEFWAFCNCLSLTSIIIQNGITTLDYAAFDNCTNLTSIIIPSSVTHIKNNCFASCFNLKSIRIPKSVTRIDNKAFLLCVNLDSITIPRMFEPNISEIFNQVNLSRVEIIYT